MSTIDFLKLNNHTKTCENVVLCAAYCDHEAHIHTVQCLKFIHKRREIQEQTIQIRLPKGGPTKMDQNEKKNSHHNREEEGEIKHGIYPIDSAK